MADLVRKTSNMYDGVLQGGVYTNADFDRDGDTNVYKCAKVHLDAGTYTFSFSKNVNIVRQIKDGVYTTPQYTNINSYTFTTATNADFGISFRDATSSSEPWDNTTTIMLNTGSTALPYEPYWPHSLKKFDGAAWQNATVTEF